MITPRHQDHDPDRSKVDPSSGVEGSGVKRKRGRPSLNAGVESSLSTSATNSNHATSAAAAIGSDISLSQDTIIMSQESGPAVQPMPLPLHFTFRNTASNNSFMSSDEVILDESSQFSTQYSEDGSRSKFLVTNSQLSFDSQLRDSVGNIKLNSSSASLSEIVTVPAPAVNPFLGSDYNPNSKNFIRKSFAPTRYMLDFEEEFLLGEGNFSKVVCARNRIDGIQYAVKKLGQRAHSDSSTKRLTKEICALAALQGCLQIIRYYSSWIDEDGRIFIQTELCPYGSLDIFVATPAAEATTNLSTFASRGRSLSAVSVSSNSSSAFYAGAVGLSIAIPTEANDSSQSSLTTPRPHHISDNQYTFAMPALRRQNSATGTTGITRQLSTSSTASNPTSSSASSTPLSSSSSLGIPENLGWLILHEMAQALHYMHGRHIAHMDIRPANIFITHSHGPININHPLNSLLAGNNSSSSATSTASTDSYREMEIAALLSGQHIIKLGDFGHATSTINVAIHDIEEGNSKYVPLEILDAHNDVDLALGDMFSLGASVYELCLGRPIQGESDEFQSIRKGTLDKYFTEDACFSQEFKSVIFSLLHITPSQRPKALDLFQLAGKYRL